MHCIGGQGIRYSDKALNLFYRKNNDFDLCIINAIFCIKNSFCKRYSDKLLDLSSATCKKKKLKIKFSTV